MTFGDSYPSSPVETLANLSSFVADSSRVCAHLTHEDSSIIIYGLFLFLFQAHISLDTRYT